MLSLEIDADQWKIHAQYQSEHESRFGMHENEHVSYGQSEFLEELIRVDAENQVQVQHGNFWKDVECNGYVRL